MQQLNRALVAVSPQHPLAIEIRAAQAVPAGHDADSEGRQAEPRQALEAALLRAVDDWPRVATLGAHGAAGGAGARVDFQVAVARQTALTVDKTDQP